MASIYLRHDERIGSLITPLARRLSVSGVIAEEQNRIFHATPKLVFLRVCGGSRRGLGQLFQTDFG